MTLFKLLRNVTLIVLLINGRAQAWESLQDGDHCAITTASEQINDYHNTSVFSLTYDKQSNMLMGLVSNPAWRLKQRTDTIFAKFDSGHSVKVPVILNANYVIIRGPDFLDKLRYSFTKDLHFTLLNDKQQPVENFSLIGSAKALSEFYSCAGTTFPVAPPTPKTAQKSDAFGRGLGGIIFLAAVCSLTPNVEACLGALAQGNQVANPTFNRPTNTTDETFKGSSTPRVSRSTQKERCFSDAQCPYGSTCVRRLNKSMCVKLTDEFGREQFNTYRSGSSAKSCLSNVDCPTRFKCNRTFKICMKR
jgi:hypothetical protein